MRLKTLFTPFAAFVILVLLAVPVSATPPSQANDPIDLTFEKCPVGPGEWFGDVEGDLSGTVNTFLTGAPATGSVWHVSFDWFVAGDGVWFWADVTGILNLKTGRVVMNGVITSGWLEGAQIHIGALLDVEDTFCSAGSMRIMPAS